MTCDVDPTVLRVRMASPDTILEDFRVGVSNKVYDAVETAMATPSELLDECRRLEDELAATLAKIQAAQRELDKTPEDSFPNQNPSLPAELHQKAEDVKKCLNLCMRMTSCTIDPNGKFTCGGVQLKAGAIASDLQANWDLIDTVTGADA